MHVPLIDLQAQYKGIKEEIDAALHRILDTSAYVLGPAVADFEAHYAQYLGVKHVVAVSDGTHAIEMALRILGVGHGDEVIVPANTFIATAGSVSHVGATPVCADVEESTYHTTAELIEPHITSKTKAIIPVHLYGQSVDLDPILALGKKYGIPVLADAAQAHGTMYKGKKVGGGAAMSTFSFYPAKNLGTYGDGGAIATDDDDYARQARMMREHGSMVRYEHEILGGNYRMSGFEGATLGVKLKYLDSWNQARRSHADLYARLLAGVPSVTLPQEAPHSVGNYYLFVIRHPQRDALLAHLTVHDVHASIHYPIPIHLQKMYGHLGIPQGTYPVAEKVTSEILSLPMYPELTDAQITHVCDTIKAFPAPSTV